MDDRPCDEDDGARRARARTRWLLLAHLVALRFALPARMAARDLRGLLDGLAPDRPWEQAPLEDALKTVARAEALVRCAEGVPDTCLYRALGRYAALRRLGAPARFVLGVKKKEGELLGHAWVEVAGAPVLEAEPPDYEVTLVHPAVDVSARPTAGCA